MTTKVLYHKNCLDGFAAAYAVWYACGDHNHEYIPVAYHEPQPEIKPGDDVLLVDFSYDYAGLSELCKIANTVTVIDHHIGRHDDLVKTARDWCNFEFSYSQDKCGCVLTWEHCAAACDMPMIFKHIQDGDLGYLWNDPDRCHPDSAAIRSQLFSLPFDFETWRNINYDEMVMKGRILHADFMTRCDRMIENAYRTRITSATKDAMYDDKGLAVNAPAEYASEVGNRLAKQSGTFGAVWSYLPGGKCAVSLRSVKDQFDVLPIAKYYGGGGHNEAAGFTIDKATGAKLRLILPDLTNGES